MDPSHLSLPLSTYLTWPIISLILGIKRLPVDDGTKFSVSSMQRLKGYGLPLHELHNYILVCAYGVMECCWKKSERNSKAEKYK